ncbi:tetratricopeptide repeat protein [Phormidium sp. CCY1219]|uniref:tetratricopeptide repeat protein n=1 Tax=Phormidium sp. CCY1219 TaxID=2886104 RepID=UPI002D1E950D|nr:tetratricopeptide repeat protein [Phormidium sp. CCY1219]MEB3831625.1 tetratricopeptide repeat protein [Phormidium sp. CCY1219]
MQYAAQFLRLFSAAWVFLLPTVSPAVAQPSPNLSPSAPLEFSGETRQLLQQGFEKFRQGEFQVALQIYQQVLQRFSRENNRAGVAETLDKMGEVYAALGDYNTALEQLQTALTHRRELNQTAAVGETLNHLGFVYRQLGDYSQALQLHGEALELAQTVANLAVKGESLHNMAAVYAATGDYNRALELYEMALSIRREVGDKRDEGRTLNNLGGVYYGLGDYDTAREYFQAALDLRRDIGDKAGVARLLSNLGLLYRQWGQSDRALELYRESLPLLREIGDLASLSNTLNGMGVLYESRGELAEALEFYEQGLEIAREIGTVAEMGNTLDNVGGIYYRLGQYLRSIDRYSDALNLRQEIGDRPGMANSLLNLGGVYFNLGQYAKSVEFLEQALVIYREVENRSGEANTLDAIAIGYEQLGDYSQARHRYHTALEIAREIGDKTAEGNILEHLGGLYAELERYDRAREFLQQALEVQQQMGNQGAIGRTLNSIANIYYRLRQYPQTLEFLQQSWQILEAVGDKSAAAITLANIGCVFRDINESSLAIVFYKKAINLNEEIRQELKSLSVDQQESFAATVEETYRNLADLLLGQNRAVEAQEVLDLLKVQELDQYLKNLRGNEKTASGVEVLPAEQELFAEFFAIQNQAIALGRERAELQQIPPAQRTSAQDQRIAEIEEILDKVTQRFAGFTRRPDIQSLAENLQQSTDGESLDLDRLDELQQSLQRFTETTVLLYPLILEDRLELVLVTPYAPPIHRTVALRQSDLNRAISEFRTALTVPSKRANIDLPKITGRQLYNWLIKPIENELIAAGAETIIYAPDGQLRYLPLAALYDGEQWLVERFTINNITAASLTNFNRQSSALLRVLAGAFTEGEYNVEVGTRQFAFSGLPFAGKEVENLAETIPTTTQLIDREFNREATLGRLNEYNIVHMATHAAFVSGQPEESFIMLGDGDRITFRDLESWSVPNVDLVVLSACQTAMGGEFGNGQEILGFGYQMQQAGALAAIASLWSVDDGGTQVLMNEFYDRLTTRNNTASALRNAQLALLDSDYQHPYYWAPFILIGNGLSTGR